MQNKQEAWYKQHHWIANNNNNTGDGKTFEFMFDLSPAAPLFLPVWWWNSSSVGYLRIIFFRTSILNLMIIGQQVCT